MAFMKAAKLAEVPIGMVKYVEVDGEEIALCNVGGFLYAIANVCTHDGGPLNQGSLDGYEIECPRHGARFDIRTGKVLRMPAVLPIQSFEVRVEGDDIQIGFDD